MRKNATVIAIISLIALAGLGALRFHGNVGGYSGELELLTIGKMPIEAHALIYIAEDQGFFAGNGLDVTIRDYDTGPEAVDALLSGQVNISGSGEYVIVSNAFKKENISIISSIDKYQFYYIAARRDRGIANASDLRGKKIGLGRRSAAEFYLGRFLNLNNLRLVDVTPVNLQPSQFVDAIWNGSVDAVVYNRQYDEAIKGMLGSNAVIWSAQSSQPLYSVMVCRNDWAASHPETVVKFLKSLVQAEHYAADNPKEAAAILQKRLGYRDEYSATISSYNQFSLMLDQSLITAMEDEGRWMINNNLTEEKTIPDFEDYIYSKGLKDANPESVNIIE